MPVLRPDLMLNSCVDTNAQRERGQGQRTLTAFSRKDFHQEVDVPAGHASFHDIALFVGMLFYQS